MYLAQQGQVGVSMCHDYENNMCLACLTWVTTRLDIWELFHSEETLRKYV